MGTNIYKMVDGQKVEMTAEELPAELTSEEIAAATAAEALERCFMNRRSEYGRILDQLDEQFHNFDAWKTRIQSVKDKYPKPE